MGCCCPAQRYSDEIVHCPDDLLKAVQNSTTLSPAQIHHLYRCFLHLGKESYKYPPTHLKKRYFLSVPRLRSNPLLTILLTSMFGDQVHLKFVNFAKYLSIFEAYPINLKPEQKAALNEKKYKLLFNMYDHDKNGIISEEDLIFIVHKMFSDIWTDHQIFKVVVQTMSEMDSHHTHQILYEDFRKSMAVFDMEDCLITRIPDVSTPALHQLVRLIERV